MLYNIATVQKQILKKIDFIIKIYYYLKNSTSTSLILTEITTMLGRVFSMFSPAHKRERQERIALITAIDTFLERMVAETKAQNEMQRAQVGTAKNIIDSSPEKKASGDELQPIIPVDAHIPIPPESIDMAHASISELRKYLDDWHSYYSSIFDVRSLVSEQLTEEIDRLLLKSKPSTLQATSAASSAPAPKAPFFAPKPPP